MTRRFAVFFPAHLSLLSFSMVLLSCYRFPKTLFLLSLSRDYFPETLFLRSLFGYQFPEIAFLLFCSFYHFSDILFQISLFGNHFSALFKILHFWYPFSAIAFLVPLFSYPLPSQSLPDLCSDGCRIFCSRLCKWTGRSFGEFLPALLRALHNTPERGPAVWQNRSSV